MRLSRLPQLHQDDARRAPRRVVLCALCALCVSWLGPAAAQQAAHGASPEDSYGAELPPQHMPRPLYARPEADPQLTEDAVQDPDQGPEQSSDQVSDRDGASSWGALSPTASLGASMSFTDDEIDKPGLAIWLGLSYHPKPARWSMYASLGLQIEAYYELMPYPIDYIPTLKVGLAWIEGQPSRLYPRTFPMMQVYALGGYRRSLVALRDGALRAGLGISSPAMAPAAAFLILHAVPVPTLLELIVDTHLGERPRVPFRPALPQRDWWIQLGVGF